MSQFEWLCRFEKVGRHVPPTQGDDVMARTKRIVSSLLVAAVAIAVPVSTPVRVEAQQPKVVSFRMAYLESFKTTELGEDEVYLLITGKWRNGQSFSYRFPSASEHWDLNDGEGDPPVLNQPLIDFTMRDGDAVDVMVMVMEEDGGTVGQWTDLAGSVIGLLDRGAGSIFGAIARFIPDIRDTDDFIGAFSVHIENRGGEIYTKFVPRDRVYSSSDPNNYWITFNVNMNGDGSDYRSTFSVTDGAILTTTAIVPQPTRVPAVPARRADQPERCPRC
jgi:hypothetical protein